MCFAGSIPSIDDLHSEKKSKYVVFKFDDLNENHWKQFKAITDIIIEKDIAKRYQRRVHNYG